MTTTIAAAARPSVYFDLSQVPMRTRLAILDDHAHQLETKGHSYWSQSPAERLANGFKLLGIGNDAKTKKGDKLGVDTGILYLAPASNATPKGETLCPNAVKAKCLAPCLFTAGRGRMSCVEMSRLFKTLFFLQERELFMETLIAECKANAAKSKRNGRVFAVRPNGTSDIDFSELAAACPEVQVYDYTKNVERLGRTPNNYHLTASYSAANADYKHGVLDAVMRGYNAAVVFRDRATAEKAIISDFLGFKCIDGDEHDVRFLDKRATAPGQSGYIVALYAKGAAKADRSGFVVDLP
jgi:hypothetical protein